MLFQNHIITLEDFVVHKRTGYVDVVTIMTILISMGLVVHEMTGAS